jgi:hypothetical protein
MRPLLPVAVAAALALALPAARAEAPAAEGRIESEEARFEILGRPLRAGDRIELPEGTLVVEEDAPDDGAVGSFGIVPAESFGATSAQPVLAAEAASPAEAGPGGAECQDERGAYLAELWRESGIVDVKDPVALLEGLQGGATGPATGYWWFALATDAFRPLAWSSELRSRADALSRCVRGHGSSPDLLRPAERGWGGGG